MIGNQMNIITSETFWTAVSSIVSTIVLIITVYQLHKQNTIQNNLDDRQDKLDERQKEIDGGALEIGALYEKSKKI